MPSKATVNLDHGFAARSMADLLTALDSEATGGAGSAAASVAETYSPLNQPAQQRHELVFFVPPKVFPHFQLHSAREDGLTRVCTASSYPAVLRNLVQWVVCMPFELFPQ